MNPQSSSSTITSDSLNLHCLHRTASGRRCRMAVAEPASGLCSKHAALHQKDLDQADLAASLIGDAEVFRSAVVINRSLGELYKLQARNKIHPRRAAVMAYTCNLLLRTPPPSSTNSIPNSKTNPRSSSTYLVPSATHSPANRPIDPARPHDSYHPFRFPHD